MGNLNVDLGQILRGMGGVQRVPAEAHGQSISGVCLDSRQVSPGDVFVAVSGTRADGAAYLEDAVRRGAAAVVCEVGATVDAACPVIRVTDARTAAAQLAAAVYGVAAAQQRGEITAVGITGTNGKSTTAFMIRGLLAAAGHKAALLGTIEYDLVARREQANLTTPDQVTLARHLAEAHAAGARYAVMEVSSHSLEQHRTDGVRFSAGVFTNLTQDHLDYHKTTAAYLAAKRRLFERLDERAAAIVNADDPASVEIVRGCQAPVIRFGFSDAADVRATVVREDVSGGRFTLHFRDRQYECATPMVGRHNISNALAAAAVGFALDLPPSAIQSGLAKLAHVPGRLQRVPTPGLDFDVFVDYAHTDDALRNVLGAARPLTRGRLWCVFGCGGDRDKTKRPKMAKAVAEAADEFVITSDNPRTEDPLAIIANIEAGLSEEERHHGLTVPDRAEAIRHAVDRLRDGDVLVIAGKGHEDYQILGTTKIHFDDVEVAAEAIRQHVGSRKSDVGCKKNSPSSSHPTSDIRHPTSGVPA